MSGVAAESLPDEIPAFVRALEATAEIAVLGRELDRSKGSGDSHDKERDPAHFVGLDDQGLVMGVMALEAIPPTREAYDSALRAGSKFTQYSAGYLPLAIVDGWQQLAKDFAYWRAASVGARTAVDPAERAWFDTDRQRRERLVIRELGVWSHYIGDASMPLHVSMHFDGWGPFYNPRGFTTKRGDGNKEGIAFATDRLTDSASVLRDLIVDAWRASADMGVGYPMIPVRDIEAGRHVLSRDDFGRD